MQLEQTQNDLEKKKTHSNFIEAESKNIKTQLSEKQNYIETLEKEVERINVQIKRIANQFPDAFALFNNPVQTVDRLKQKAENDLMNGLGKALTTILFEQHREKYVLTDIFDISKPLEFKISDHENLQIPTSEQLTQTFIE